MIFLADSIKISAKPLVNIQFPCIRTYHRQPLSLCVCHGHFSMTSWSYRSVSYVAFFPHAAPGSLFSGDSSATFLCHLYKQTPFVLINHYTSLKLHECT